MNEKLRMQYLEVLGIDYFVPRYVLPNAAEPVECLMPAANESRMPDESLDDFVASVPVEATDNANASSEAPISRVPTPHKTSSMLQSVAEENLKPVVKTARSVLESMVEPSAEVVEFALSVWRIGPSLLAIDTREVGAALPTEALLDNIVRACGIEASLPGADSLQWPLVNIPGKPQGWPEARSMVATYLEGKLSHPVATILLFGESACKAVLGENDYSQQVWKSVPVDAFVCNSVVLPSLADILRNTELKARVWQCLVDQGVAGW